MSWGRAIFIFLRNTVISIALAGLVMGIIGFAIAGREGFLNGLTWGLALGSLSIVPMFFALVNARFWGGYAERSGDEWYRKQFENDEETRRR